MQGLVTIKITIFEMSTVVRQPGFCFLSVAVQCWKSNQISLSFCCRINESNGYFCPKQINNSSVPFRPEIPLKRNSKFFSTVNRTIVLFFSYPCSSLTTERAPLSVIQMTWLTFIWIPFNPICDFAPLAEGQTRP